MTPDSDRPHVRVRAMTRKELEKLQASDDETFAGLTERHPKQARSRETLGRLLDAAESLLTEGGLEAATVPAIADRAGLSVGVVYRRFPDKDALLRAVYLRFFGRLAELNRQNLAIVASREWSLTEMTRKMVEGMVKGYRLKRGILRALVLYARTHQDAEFRRASQELNQNTTAAIAALLMTRRSEIHHPKPESAIEFGLLAIASVLHAVILEEEPMHGITTQHNLEEELVRLFFGYLGIKEVESGRLARK